MKPYFEEIYSALSLLFRVCLIYMVFLFSKTTSESSINPAWKIYFKTILIVVCIAFYVAYSYGEHVEGGDDFYPMWGENSVVEDFEPTDQQRGKKGLYVFTVLIIPCIIGVYEGIKKRKIK